MAIGTILLIIAFVCFVCAAVGVQTRINLTATGLAFVTAATLIAGYVFA